MGDFDTWGHGALVSHSSRSMGLDSDLALIHGTNLIHLQYLQINFPVTRIDRCTSMDHWYIDHNQTLHELPLSLVKLIVLIQGAGLPR